VKLKHIPVLMTDSNLSLEDSSNQGFIEKASNAFRELKGSFSKKLEAKNARKAIEDVSQIRRVLVDFKNQLSKAEFKEGQQVNMAQALESLQMTAISPQELIAKLKKRLTVLKNINKQVLAIESLKNARMTNELKETEAKKRLEELKKEYKSLFEKPSRSAKMAFKKSEAYELANLGIQYCDAVVEFNKHIEASKIVMEDVTDNIQSFFEWIVDLVVDISAFIYSIFSGLIRFVVGIFIVIFFLANPVAGVIIFLGTAMILEIVKDVQERSEGDHEYR
jgi:hypothetical protein